MPFSPWSITPAERACESKLLLVGQADAGKHQDAALLEQLANVSGMAAAQQSLQIGPDARSRSEG